MARPYQPSLLRLLHGTTAAGVLLPLAMAIGTGKLMQEDWLRQGNLSQLVYSLHLIAWGVMAMAVLAHLAGVLARGGWPLAGSMASLRLKAGDRPADWPRQLAKAVRRSDPPARR
ncbi:hypothetical protein KBZ18_03580 [Synechococcus sp. Cruz-9H2]|uniref:hypothetical protein n=1 Tax=unclassified Synechococcus TaxID=2626047 RepID=UPI0020CDF1B8|nr:MULTISPECIES: hypothetical protein [unclassified Synechococcus]MCP9818573.1 hypothetical protein [Synechococcus sp. Cruz-9H2]MCP9842804.1 hypothetical protein [Synechococcus sp. Edmonson 11F2]MCP9855469.1 hypothetical protein [Synechococcus sp. Cruz-9C9]MCP9862284.1 hypothetical protein [Synechococcus sp. Cruz-7E5]MCP9869556.1 hypothetical protein [Synechococcus sp. Cruz-7B9]